MNEWKNDIHWLKKEENKNLYLMRDHNYAFSAWEIGRLEGSINKNATLFHVDAHIDDVPDGHTVKGILDLITTKQEAIELGRGHDHRTGTSPKKEMLKIDNFIWPGVLRNTIGNRYYVSFDDLDHYENNELNDTGLVEHYTNVFEHNKKIIRYPYVEDLSADLDIILKKEKNNTVILDLDLDYFNQSNNLLEPILMEHERIIDNLNFLKKMFQWDLITVALSPLHCGGEEQCQYLLETFMEVFDIKCEKLKDW